MNMIKIICEWVQVLTWKSPKFAPNELRVSRLGVCEKSSCKIASQYSDSRNTRRSSLQKFAEHASTLPDKNYCEIDVVTCVPVSCDAVKVHATSIHSDDSKSSRPEPSASLHLLNVAPANTLLLSSVLFSFLPRFCQWRFSRSWPWIIHPTINQRYFLSVWWFLNRDTYN